MNLNPERERQRRYEKNNREKERERKREWRARMATAKSPAHGKTRSEIHAILQAQGAKCAICETTRHGGRGWHGDHDHRTGLFRGVLCAGCNTALGGFRDRVKSLRAAIYYLEMHAHRQAKLKELF